MKKYVIAMLFLSQIAGQIVGAQTLEQVELYQKKQIEQILYNYNQEAHVRFEVINQYEQFEKVMSELGLESKKDVVELPGLFISNVSVPTEQNLVKNILQVLPKLNTKVRLILKSPIENTEKELVLSRIQNALSLKDPSQIEVEDQFFDSSDFFFKVRSEFWSSLYRNLIENGYLFIFSVAFFLFSLLYAILVLSIEKLSKALRESRASKAAPQESSVTKRPEPAKPAEPTVVESKKESLEETPDFDIAIDSERFVQNVLQSTQTDFTGSKYILWKHLPTREEQMYFMNYIKSQDKISREQKEKIKTDLMSIFGWENLSQYIVPKKPEPKAFLEIEYSLNQLEFNKMDDVSQKFINSLFPKFGLYLDKVIDKFILTHFDLFYKYFPDKTIQVSQRHLDKTEVQEKLMKTMFLAFDEIPLNEVALQDFIQKLDQLSPKDFDSLKKKIINQKVLDLFISMSDEQLKTMSFFDKLDEDTKSALPTTHWIRPDADEALKNFLNDLSPEEAKYLEVHVLPYNDFLSRSDERTKYRFSEKVQMSTGAVLDWKQFRSKIGQYFTHPDETPYDGKSQVA
jgi:DNA-directed RNA polymerase subunit F